MSIGSASRPKIARCPNDVGICACLSYLGKAICAGIADHKRLRAGCPDRAPLGPARPLRAQRHEPVQRRYLNQGQGAQFTGNLVNHVTYFTNCDEMWATFTETGKVAGTDDGTGVTYTGQATARATST